MEAKLSPKPLLAKWVNSFSQQVDVPEDGVKVTNEGLNPKVVLHSKSNKKHNVC